METSWDSGCEQEVEGSWKVLAVSAANKKPKKVTDGYVSGKTVLGSGLPVESFW